MARKFRVISPIDTYHAILRGNDRQDIFYDDEDRHQYLNTLKEYNKEFQIGFKGYCLMDNHIHLVLKTDLKELTEYLKRSSISFVSWYNHKYDRCGHLFQDRFRSEAIYNDRHLLNIVRYVHNNPQKAGIVGHFADYKWSSIGDYLNNTGLTDVAGVLNLFQGDDPLGDFMIFHGEKNEDNFIENDAKPSYVADAMAAERIVTCFGDGFISDLKKYSVEKRNNFIKELCNQGYNTSQLSRIIKYSRGLISSIKNEQ